jgi:hypothetical protein
MFLPPREDDFGTGTTRVIHIPAVDKSVDGDGRDTEGFDKRPGGELEDGLMIVICEQHGPEVDVVVCGLGDVDDDRPEDVFGVLERVV